MRVCVCVCRHMSLRMRSRASHDSVRTSGTSLLIVQRDREGVFVFTLLLWQASDFHRKYAVFEKCCDDLKSTVTEVEAMSQYCLNVVTESQKEVAGDKDKMRYEKLKAAPVGDVTFEVSRVYRAPRVPPPGAPPGGEWKNEKYCGCISCLACMVCGCLVLLCGPYDERTVYVLTDGKKYKEDGTRIDTY